MLIIRKDLKVSWSCICIRVATLSDLTLSFVLFFQIYNLCLRSVAYFCRPVFYVMFARSRQYSIKKNKSGIESIFCFQKKQDHSIPVIYVWVVLKDLQLQRFSRLSVTSKISSSIWSNSNYWLHVYEKRVNSKQGNI